MQQPRFQTICDLANCNEKIKDPRALRKFLKELVRAVDMKILEGPIVAQGFPDNPGLSAVVIIDYSHISIHTFTKYNEALIDIFSCRPFDKEKLIDYCHAFFKASKEKSRVKEVWWG